LLKNPCCCRTSPAASAAITLHSPALRLASKTSLVKRWTANGATSLFYHNPAATMLQSIFMRSATSKSVNPFVL